MSVYTPVGREELDAWLTPLALGRLIEYAGIAAGMQNSNYFVTTERGRYVLTLFERPEFAYLDFHLALMEHLARRGIACPLPLAGADGRLWRSLADKPASLLTCLPGANCDHPDVAQCRAVGVKLAELHLAAADFPDPLPNPCGTEWRAKTGATLLPHLPVDEAAMLAEELAVEAASDWAALPRGVIHADLFRDNVLWDSCGALAGILDFYFAGEDVWLFDLAVVANDWCRDGERLAALIAGYQSRRLLTEAEGAAWPAIRRAAALRFWLLRLDARYRPRAGEVVTIKNPDEYRDLLLRLRLAPEALPR